MKETLHLFLILAFIFYYTEQIQAQECTVTLSGTYRLDPESEEGLYDAFVFDGAGKVEIQALLKSKGDFLQIGDTVIVYPDKSLFIFLKKDEHTLVGINTWVQDQVFRKMENDTVLTPAPVLNPDYANQFYEFYTLTGRVAPDLSTYLHILTDSSMHNSMNRLCDKGFPKACITLANALMLKSPELAAFFQDSSEKITKKAPNKEIFDYFMKAIELNEVDAIAQLGAYFLLLGYKEEAKKVFEKGCELGHSGCCLSLAGLEIASGLDEKEE